MDKQLRLRYFSLLNRNLWARRYLCLFYRIYIVEYNDFIRGLTWV